MAAYYHGSSRLVSAMPCHPKGRKYDAWREIPDMSYKITDIKSPCCCAFDACATDRADHLLGSYVIAMPREKDRFLLWCPYLGYPLDTIEGRQYVEEWHATYISNPKLRLNVAIATHFPSQNRSTNARGKPFIKKKAKTNFQPMQRRHEGQIVPCRSPLGVDGH